MQPLSVNSKYHFIFWSLVVNYAIVIRANVRNSAIGKRIVYPSDLIRFSCIKYNNNELDNNNIAPPPSRCTWNFTVEGSKEKLNLTKDCTLTTLISNNVTKLKDYEYEGYFEVPAKATAVSCGGIVEPQPLNVQKVKLATPITSGDQSVPRIVLQRFSDDFLVRLASHDVTNKEVQIDGGETRSIKLLCIYSSPVRWINITGVQERIIRDVMNKNNVQVFPKSDDQDKWGLYLKFLTDVEQISVDYTQIQSSKNNDKGPYNLSTFVIRDVTNMTSRTYTCKSNQTTSSNVTIKVENPQKIGPDEIQLIQEIISILDSQKDGRKDSWYPLGILISVSLSLFMYYCKKKLGQPQGQTNPKPEAPVPAEEAEMTTILRRNVARSEDNLRGHDQKHQNGPESVLTEHQQT